MGRTAERQGQEIILKTVVERRIDARRKFVVLKRTYETNINRKRT
jgi:hypothetical protein